MLWAAWKMKQQKNEILEKKTRIVLQCFWFFGHNNFNRNIFFQLNEVNNATSGKLIKPQRYLIGFYLNKIWNWLFLHKFQILRGFEDFKWTIFFSQTFTRKKQTFPVDLLVEKLNEIFSLEINYLWLSILLDLVIFQFKKN